MIVTGAIQSPLLSIVIPTWNREKECLRLLESLKPLGSSENYEVIINDNHSSDQTVSVVKNYINSFSLHKNINVFENSFNIGPALNWLNAVKRSTGKYVLLLFSDDMLKFSPSFDSEEFFDELNKLAFADVSLIRLGSSIVSSNLNPSELSYLHYLPKNDCKSKKCLTIEESCTAFLLNYILPLDWNVPGLNRTFSPVSPTGYLIERKSIINTLAKYSAKQDSFLLTGAGIDSLCILQSTLNSTCIPSLTSVTALMVASSSSITANGHKNRSKKLLLERSYALAHLIFLKNLLKSSPFLGLLLYFVAFARYIKNISLRMANQK